jgi:cardiolipin synthase
LLGSSDVVGHFEQPSDESGGAVDPVIDLLDRHDEGVPGLDRIDREEHGTLVVSPDEVTRDVAVEDAREDRRHRGTVRDFTGDFPVLRWRVVTDALDVTKPGETDRLLTVPNLVTVVRLGCLPLFLWLLFGRDNRAGAAWLLGGLGATDWVDGYVARRFGQVSEFGKMLDPIADRLLFIVGIAAIIIDGSAPLWVCVLVLARELALGITVASLTVFAGMQRFDVTYWGKLATFLLMFAFPGFMLGASDFWGHQGFQIASWILVVPGLALSYYTALAYVPTIAAHLRAGRKERSS